MRIRLFVLPKSIVKRLLTADEPVVNRGFCSSVGFKYELDCSCFRRDVQDSCLRYPGVHEGQMFPGRTGPSTSLPARPCAAPPRPASTRPWYVWVLDSASHARPVRELFDEEPSQVLVEQLGFFARAGKGSRLVLDRTNPATGSRRASESSTIY